MNILAKVREAMPSINKTPAEPDKLNPYAKPSNNTSSSKLLRKTRSDMSELIEEPDSEDSLDDDNRG